MKSIISFVLLLSIPAISIAQNIGINIDTPTRARLELNGMIGNSTAIFGGDGNGIGLIASWPEIGFNTYFNGGNRYIGNGYGLIQSFDPGSGYWGFDMLPNGSINQLSASAKRALTFSGNGRVGIGDNSGFDATLNVNRPSGMDGTAYFAASRFSAFNYTASEYTVVRGPANLNPVFLNYNTTNSKISLGNGTGCVGIGWGSPVYALEIHGNSFQLSLLRSGSQNRWTFGVFAHSSSYFKLFTGATGQQPLDQRGSYDYTNGSYHASSDRRIKENIAPLQPMLDKIMLLRPVRYEMKYNNSAHHVSIGLIAQDVEAIFHELVHARKADNLGYPGIDSLHLLNYGGLAPVVVKGLQEQQLMLDDIMKRVNNLEKEWKE